MGAYVSSRKKLKIPKLHCKRCHYTWMPRDEYPPEKCSNNLGYTNEEGRVIPKCGSRQWFNWPKDFDPNTCKCEVCTFLHLQEKFEKQEAEQEHNPIETKSAKVI